MSLIILAVADRQPNHKRSLVGKLLPLARKSKAVLQPILPVPSPTNRKRTNPSQTIGQTAIPKQTSRIKNIHMDAVATIGYPIADRAA
jgi:hypothetical protein